MEVVRVRGSRLTLELTPRERTALTVAGLRLELAEMGCKAVVVSMEEADAMGLKPKKGAERIELTEDDSRLLIQKAVGACLERRIAEEKARMRAGRKAKRK